MKPEHNLLYSNDTFGQYPPSYYAASANESPAFSVLKGDEAADVCIIGAGYTGLSAALHLAQAGYKTIVLEAHRVGWGASGRNGGQVGTGQNQHQDELETWYGEDQARILWDISWQAVDLVKSLVSQHSIQCDWQPGIINADHRQRYVKHTQQYVEKLQNEYDHDQIRFLDKAAIKQHINSPCYHGGSLDIASAHIHPLNYALGLATAAKQAGAIIYEQSPVLEYSKSSPAIVRCKTGRVKAKHVILACNGYLGDLDKSVAARVMPINNFIIATEPMSDQDRQSLITHRHAVADSKFVVNYFRFSADNRLLFGGGENYSYKFPNDIPAFVKPHMTEVFPQLENCRIDYGWGGTLAITMKRMPYFKQLAPHVLSASGYSGHGIAMATMAGKILADVVDGTMSQFDVMQSLKTYPFPGGRLLRSPLLALAMVYYSLRDKI